MRGKRLIGVLVLGLAVLVAGSAGRTFASPPDFQIDRFDSTFISPFWSNVCGFSVERHTVGWVKVTSFFDQYGNLTREIDQFFRTDTLSANGLSITGNSHESDHGTYNPDGSITVLAAGPQPMFVQPGSGPIWATSGSILYQISPDGDVTVLRESGINVGDQAAVCAALTP